MILQGLIENWHDEGMCTLTFLVMSSFFAQTDTWKAALFL